MTRFFVTGAHGFIGRAIVERLREQGGEVRGVDLLAGDDPAVVRGDVSLPGEWHAQLLHDRAPDEAVCPRDEEARHRNTGASA